MRPTTLVAAGVAAALLAVAPALAQAPAAPAQSDILFTPSAGVAAALAKAKADRKEGQNMSPVVPVLVGPGMRADVEWRIASTPASVHETLGEFFYVVEGTGSLQVGGTLNAPTRTNASNLSGTGITGGVTHPLAKGDFLYVPAGVPHYFATVGQPGLGVITLKVPAPAP